MWRPSQPYRRPHDRPGNSPRRAMTGTGARNTRRALAALGMAAIAGAIVYFHDGGLRPRDPPPQVAEPAETAAGQALYALSMPDADGHAQKLGRWKGKWLLINFWATWCAPCVAEMPGLEKVADAYAARNLAVVGIGVEDLPKVRQFRDRLGLHMNLLAGGYDAMTLARTLGDAQGVLPYTALLSPDGLLLQVHVGALEPGEVQEWLLGIHGL
jgi:peroxiredoxin